MTKYVTNFELCAGDQTDRIYIQDPRNVVGRYIPVTQKFIRSYTDPDHNGDVLIGGDNYSMAFQGMCITPAGIVSARTDNNRPDKTCWVLLDTNGNFIKRDYVNAGHCNGMAYYNEHIYATYNVSGQTTVLKRFNATTWAYEKTYDDIHGGNVCIDKNTGTLYSLSDSLNVMYIMDIATETVTTVPLNRPDGTEFNQGSCFYDGYIYVLGYYTLNIFDTSGNFIGSSFIAQTDSDGILIRECEDLDVWDDNGTFLFLSGFQMSNTSIRNTSGEGVNMYLTGAYYGILSLEYCMQTNTKPTGNINLSRPNAVYVECSGEADVLNAKYQDGTSSFPFKSFFAASLITYGISTLSADDYNYIPDSGDCFSPQSIVARFVAPTQPLNLRAPLIFKYGTFYSDAFNITAKQSTYYPLNVQDATFNNIVIDDNDYMKANDVVVHARLQAYVNILNSHSLQHQLFAYVDSNSYINAYLIGTRGSGKIWTKTKLQFDAATTFTLPLPQCWSSYSKTVHLYAANSHKMYTGAFVSTSHIVLGDNYIATSISGNNVTFSNLPEAMSQIIIS